MLPPAALPRPLRGIVPPLVTPLLETEQLDAAAHARQIERVIDGGVAAVFVLGTTGEAPSLSLELRREVIAVTCRCVRGRVPVLVGITDACPAHSLALARAAADAGARAVVLSVPYYFPPDQTELEALARRVARASPLPVFLYNIPQFTRTAYEAPTVRRLADEPRIVGIKDSSGDLAYFRELTALARERPDWTVLMGPEELLAAGIAAGGHGGVNGGALLCPRLLVDLCAAAQAGDTARVALLQPQLESLGRIYHVSPHPAAVFKAIKCALALLGVCADRMAAPLLPLTPAEREQVRRILAECGLLPGAAAA
jgi:4-hydroxy-tetrahydrodipicolinate synthase